MDPIIRMIKNIMDDNIEAVMKMSALIGIVLTKEE
jgi:hypothetical protein